MSGRCNGIALNNSFVVVQEPVSEVPTTVTTTGMPASAAEQPLVTLLVPSVDAYQSRPLL